MLKMRVQQPELVISLLLFAWTKTHAVSDCNGKNLPWDGHFKNCMPSSYTGTIVCFCPLNHKSAVFTMKKIPCNGNLLPDLDPCSPVLSPTEASSKVSSSSFLGYNGEYYVLFFGLLGVDIGLVIIVFALVFIVCCQRTSGEAPTSSRVPALLRKVQVDVVRSPPAEHDTKYEDLRESLICKEVEKKGAHNLKKMCEKQRYNISPSLSNNIHGEYVTSELGIARLPPHRGDTKKGEVGPKMKDQSCSLPEPPVMYMDMSTKIARKTSAPEEMIQYTELNHNKGNDETIESLTT